LIESLIWLQQEAEECRLEQTVLLCFKVANPAGENNPIDPFTDR